MKKTWLLLIAMLLLAMTVIGISETDTDVLSFVSGLLPENRYIPLNAQSPFEGSDENAVNGICFYFDTNRVYVYGRDAGNSFKQYVFIGVSYDDMAKAIPEICDQFKQFDGNNGETRFVITAGIDDEYSFARSADEAKELAKKFSLLTGIGNYRYITIKSNANVRRNPSMDARLLGHVAAGSQQLAVEKILDETGAVWYKIEFDEGYGYISGNVVTESNN